MKIFKIKTRLKISYVIILIIFLIIFFEYPERKYLKIYDRKSEVVFLREEVKEGDMLRLEIEHSFEHIPWFEYYQITDDYFLLKKKSQLPDMEQAFLLKWTYLLGLKTDLYGWKILIHNLMNWNGLLIMCIWNL